MLSCGTKNDIYPIYFDYSTLKISVRTVWIPNINFDTVKVIKVNRNKIQLILTLGDTVKSNYLGLSRVISNINGFATLSARDSYYEEYFTANQKINKIEIYTLQNFNDSIHSGADISKEFLVDNGDALYTKISNADDIFNIKYFSNPYNTIYLVCKIPAKGAIGQFRVKVILSDERVLEAKTQPVQFVENNEN